MFLLSLSAWILLLGLLGSGVYGIISYIMYKLMKGVLVSDVDGPGLKEALIAIDRAEDATEIKEMEVKALYNYPTYREVILGAVEEKKNSSYALTSQKRWTKIRRWWLSAFIVYYALTSLAFVPAFMDCGFHNIPALGRVLGMFVTNILFAVIVYHCAFRNSGTRLLLCILFFLPLYVLGICIMIGMQSSVFQEMSCDWECVKAFLLEVVLPLVVIFAPITFYWITSLYLLKANRLMSKIQKLKNIKALLQL